MFERKKKLILGAGACLAIALPSKAESVLQPGITTFRAMPRSCQDVTFGQHSPVQGVHFLNEATFHGVLLGADVQDVQTRDFDGQLIANPPAWRTSKGLTFFVLEGTAKDLCPRLKPDRLELQLVPLGCDTLPASGTCLIPQMPFVRLPTPDSRPPAKS